nr:alpha/beta hydrolase [Niabella ginsengisoli]
MALYSKNKAGNEAFKIFCTPHFRMVYEGSQIENAEHISLEFQGLNTIGYRWNKGGSKKALIVHGFRSSSINFQHFATKLAAKGYEVMAFDAPAHGLSEGKMLNAVDYKNYIAAVNQQFGPFDAYLCHSFGGLAVSMNLAEMADNKKIRTALIAPAANSKQLIESFFKEMHIANKKVQEHFYATINKLSGKDIEWFSIKRCVEDIQGDIFWIHDTNDHITPINDALEIQKMKQPNFRFMFTNGLGHRRIYRDSEVISAIVDFL